MRLYERGPTSRADSLGDISDHKVRGHGVVEGMEQHSTLYGLPWWKDKVGGRLPAAQFHTWVVKRPDA